MSRCDASVSMFVSPRFHFWLVVSLHDLGCEVAYTECGIESHSDSLQVALEGVRHREGRKGGRWAKDAMRYVSTTAVAIVRSLMRLGVEDDVNAAYSRLQRKAQMLDELGLTKRARTDLQELR